MLTACKDCPNGTSSDVIDYPPDAGDGDDRCWEMEGSASSKLGAGGGEAAVRLVGNMDRGVSVRCLCPKGTGEVWHVASGARWNGF